MADRRERKKKVFVKRLPIAAFPVYSGTAGQYQLAFSKAYLHHQPKTLTIQTISSQQYELAKFL